jgi:general secretion pathway protein D
MRYLIAVLLVSILFANNCENKLFTFESKGGSDAPLSSFLSALVVDNCGLNIVYDDDLAKQRVNTIKIGKVSVKDYTLGQLLDLLISSNNLFYKIQKNKLHISYIQTKTFNIDYIPSTRTGSSTFQASTSQDNKGDINSVDSKYEFNFWDTLADNLDNILNTVDTYKAKKPIIDKNSGLVTVTATKRQLDRISKYGFKASLQIVESLNPSPA